MAKVIVRGEWVDVEVWPADDRFLIECDWGAWCTLPDVGLIHGWDKAMTKAIKHADTEH